MSMQYKTAIISITLSFFVLVGLVQIAEAWGETCPEGYRAIQWSVDWHADVPAHRDCGEDPARLTLECEQEARVANIKDYGDYQAWRTQLIVLQIWRQAIQILSEKRTKDQPLSEIIREFQTHMTDAAAANAMFAGRLIGSLMCMPTKCYRMCPAAYQKKKAPSKKTD